MGSVKKKVNKVFNKAADKLIPKELAPILPYASMILPFIPGVGTALGGILSSTVGRYAVPQLLTALSTAKQTGEIDPTQQLLTAGTSYLAGGPNVGDSTLGTAGNAPTNVEAAYLKANPNAAMSATQQAVPDVISGGVNVSPSVSFQDFTKIDPDALAKFSKTYKPESFTSGLSDFGQGLQRAAQGDLGFGKQALTLGSALGTELTRDIASRAVRKQKEKDDRRKLGISEYRSASDELADYYANMVGDYDRMYGGLDFGKRFLNDGGSVKELPNKGLKALNKVAPEVVTRMGFEDGGTAVSPERFNDLVRFAMDEGFGIAEAFEYARRTAAGEQMNKGGRVGMNMGGVPSELMAIEQRMPVTKPDIDFVRFLEEAQSMNPMVPRLSAPMGKGRKDPDVPAKELERSDTMLEKILEKIKKNKTIPEPVLPIDIGRQTLEDMLQSQESILTPKDVESDLSKLFFKLMGRPDNQYNAGGRVGMNSGGVSDLLNNALGGKDVSGSNKLFLLDALSNFQGSEGLMSLLGSLLGGMNKGGRVGMNMGGMGSIPQTPNVPKGKQVDGRGGGFIPMGAKEKKDDVPAMLAKNEFVMTSDAVKAAGGGSVEKGAQRMYDVMNNLEAQV
tara:strand:+ start:6049 stop:7905 length:1857 start_codon:yes stop_codon:yes gene_type:complete